MRSRSICWRDFSQRLYSLPAHRRLFLCHDYRPGGRPLCFETTVKEQQEANIQLNARTTKEEFVVFRTKRDAQLERYGRIFAYDRVR